jgi:hypothetical protein
MLFVFNISLILNFSARVNCEELMPLDTLHSFCLCVGVLRYKPEGRGFDFR